MNQQGAYEDDAILTATAQTFTEAHKILVDMMTRTGRMIDWLSIKYCKLALFDFVHHGIKKPHLPLVLSNITLDPYKVPIPESNT